MPMFDNYNNNCNPHQHCPPPKPGKPNLHPVRPNRPYEEYNAKGELIGYYWYYGDSVNIEYNIDGEITDVETMLYMKADEWITTKKCKITLLDFRHETVLSQIFPGSSKIVLSIDGDLSKSLLRGVYYCKLEIVEPDNEEIIIDQTDESTLYVK